MITLFGFMTLLAIGVFVTTSTIWSNVDRVKLAMIIVIVYLIVVACIAAWIYYAAYSLPDGAVVLEPPPKS